MTYHDPGSMTPPPALPARPLLSNRLTMPTIGTGTGQVQLIPGTGIPDPALNKPTSEVVSSVGWLRIVIDGRDVTFWRGVQTSVESITMVEPGTYGAASIKFPQVTGYDYDTLTVWSWLHEGASVKIQLVEPVSGVMTPTITLFEGVLISISHTGEMGDTGEFSTSVECQGTLFASADNVIAKPELLWDTRDIGNAIADLMNDVPGRKYAKLKQLNPSTGLLDTHTKIGIETRSRSNGEQLFTGRVTDLLSNTTCDGGATAWTVSCEPGGHPVMHKKDHTTVHWTIGYGTPGATVNLSSDATQAPTHIYGTGTDGPRGWSNLKIPGYDPDGLPTFYSSSPAAHLVYGDNSAGVTKVKARLKELGYRGFTNDNHFGTGLKKAIKTFQRKNGLRIDSEISAQLWARLFGWQGDYGWADAYYAPLAYVSEAEPYTYSDDSQGNITGNNTAYNPSKLRVERTNVYPENTDKDKAKTFAAQELARDKTPGWTGDITLRVCPEEGPRWKIKSGDNIMVKNYRGSNVLLHITQVTFSPNDNEVSLTVDEKLRDLQTMQAIKTRNKEAKNPARRSHKNRIADLKPTKPVFDSELVGHIPAMPLETKTWSVVRIPVAVAGDLVKVDCLTYDSAQRFVFAIFADKISPHQIKKTVGDPWDPANFDESGTDVFAKNETVTDTLTGLAFINAAGGSNKERAGYSPGKQEDAHPVITGRLYTDVTPMSFESARPPYVWVAINPENACWFKGRVWVNPQGV